MTTPLPSPVEPPWPRGWIWVSYLTQVDSLPPEPPEEFQRLTSEKESWIKNVSNRANKTAGRVLKGQLRTEAGTSGLQQEERKEIKLRKIKLPSTHMGWIQPWKSVLPASSVFMVECCWWTVGHIERSLLQFQEGWTTVSKFAMISCRNDTIKNEQEKSICLLNYQDKRFRKDTEKADLSQECWACMMSKEKVYQSESRTGLYSVSSGRIILGGNFMQVLSWG